MAWTNATPHAALNPSLTDAAFSATPSAPDCAPSIAPDCSSNALLLEVLGQERLAQLDRFDQPQLAQVIHTCRQAPSLSAAGRFLFQASRNQKSSHNDADRLRKYLARFNLEFEQLRQP
jgi:sigma54-dependent transcription regulator